MDECCKTAVEKAVNDEWKHINGWKPFLHYCAEWDYLLIDQHDDEFRACRCYPDKMPKKTETDANG